MALEKSKHDSAIVNSFLSKFKSFSKEDKTKIISELINELEKNHNIIYQEILAGTKSVQVKEKEIRIPVGVFSNDALSSLEAIVKYLKEDLKIKFSKIGKLTNRSNKTIWTTYHNALKKMPSSFGAISEEISIPVSVFFNRSFSILEWVVGYIKDLGYSNHEVALMLHLDDRTIWTVWDRVKKKRGMNP